MTSDETEYVEYLEGERRRFAWVMRHYGGKSAKEAEAAALDAYPYEAADNPYRGLVFHDEAWHWAMLQIHPGYYWIDHPELARPPEEYDALD
ncbi:hypothetical protein [Amycolatopsis benzoatilytica]|uniref:hypothetical protein n=1 Tax=Amycolatopsis benzoatilytica TaxID=346045 RepID=UPI000381F1EF|nr:hypothetical protein [Amycolatopsis benzoatilytica]